MKNPYRMTYRLGHPLAPKSGRMGLHRAVLYDAIGPGPHPCHECQVEVNWSTRRTAKGSLVVDHLDGDPANNARENLAPCCHSCNTRRGHDRRLSQGLVIVTDRGRKAAMERTCVQCAKPFLVVMALLTNKGSTNTGEYCSRLCQNTAQARANAEKQKAATAGIAERVKALRDEEGLTFGAIAARLDEEGIKPPKSAKWNSASVYVLYKRVH